MVEHAVVSPSDSDLMGVVQRLLRRSTDPMTATNLLNGIPQPYRVSPVELERRLDEAIAAGTIWKYAPYRGKSPGYLDRPPEAFAKEVLLRKLADEALTASALDKKVASRLRDVSPRRRQEIRDALVASGQVRKWPPKPGSRSFSYSVHRPDPREYLVRAVSNFRRAVDGIVKDLHGVDVAPDATLRAAWELLEQQFAAEARHPAASGAVVSSILPGSAPEIPKTSMAPDAIESQILERLRHLGDAAVGNPLIRVADIRRSVDFMVPDKVSFDRAMLHLSSQGLIALHQHDFPQQLSPVERELLVCDGHRYFSGAALRQRPQDL